MNIRQVVENYVGVHVVDTDTGEVLTVIPDTKKRKKVTNFDKYVGIDVRYPKDCLTSDQLLTTLSVMDGYVTQLHKVNDTFLVESVLAGLLTLQQQVFLRNLARCVVGWNYFYGTTKELTSFGVDSKSLSRLLKTLEENHYLRVVRKDTPYKGDICITLNPMLVWRGDNQYRDAAKMKWYSVKTDPQY